MTTAFTVKLYRSCSSYKVGLSSPVRSVHVWCCNPQASTRTSRSPWHQPRRLPSSPRHFTVSAIRFRTDDNVEMFKSTETITDATGTGSVESIGADVLSQPAVDFASLGLGGYWPSGLIQSTMELLHVHTHLPWWGCIVLLTGILRLAYFPLTIKMQIVGAKVANANKEAKAIQQRIMLCRASGDKVGESQAGVDMMKLYQRTANPFLMFPLGFGQVPIFLSMFRGLQGMAMLPLESLRTGGMLWFVDLAAPDPYYLLPIVACSSFLVNIQLGGEGGASADNEVSRKVRMALSVGAVAILPFTVTFPAAILTYWVSNSVLSMVQILLFKQHSVKKFFGIPIIVR